jgi:type IV pilus assembly protein PilM
LFKVPFLTPSQLIGLDIGSSSIKLVELKPKGKQWALLRAGKVPIDPEVIVEGAIINEAQLVEAVQSLIQKTGVHSKYVAISFGGPTVIVKRVSLPKMQIETLRANLRNEVAEHIPFSLDEVNVDIAPVGEDPNEPDRMGVILVATKKETVGEFLAVLVSAGLKALVADLSAFAVANAFFYNYPELLHEPLAIIHLGSSVTTVNIVHEGRSLFVRDLARGGYEITSEIQKLLGVSYEEAENFKRGGSGEEDALIPEEVGTVLRNKFQDLASDVQRTFDYFIQQGGVERVGRIFISGGMSLTSGIAGVLEERLGLPVETMNPFRRIALKGKGLPVDELQREAPIYSVAVGLALRRAFDT